MFYTLIIGTVAIIFAFMAGFDLPYWMVIPLLLIGITALYVIVNVYGKDIEDFDQAIEVE